MTWTPPVAGTFREITEEFFAYLPRSPKEAIRTLMQRFGLDRASAKAEFRLYRNPNPEKRTRVYESELYRVFRNPNPDNPTLVHLSIRPLCGTARHDWRELQAIKNAILGAECEAVEIYPAESRLMDEANQFHLWGCSTPGVRIPFGTPSGVLADRPVASGCTQRGRDGINREMLPGGEIVEVRTSPG